MWFIGTTQPNFNKTAGEYEFSTYLSRNEKLDIIKRLDDGTLTLPLCIGHAGGNHANFEVPKQWRTGEIEFGFLDGTGALMVFGKIDEARIETKALSKDIKEGNRPWGLSLWTEYMRHSNRAITDKRVTHVGITPNPDLADYGTFIYYSGDNRHAVLRKVRDHYLKEEKSFVTDKVKSMLSELSVAGSDLEMSVPSSDETKQPATKEPRPATNTTKDAVTMDVDDTRSSQTHNESRTIGERDCLKFAKEVLETSKSKEGLQRAEFLKDRMKMLQKMIGASGISLDRCNPELGKIFFTMQYDADSINRELAEYAKQVNVEAFGSDDGIFSEALTSPDVSESAKMPVAVWVEAHRKRDARNQTKIEELEQQLQQANENNNQGMSGKRQRSQHPYLGYPPRPDTSEHLKRQRANNNSALDTTERAPISKFEEVNDPYLRSIASKRIDMMGLRGDETFQMLDALVGEREHAKNFYAATIEGTNIW